MHRRRAFFIGKGIDLHFVRHHKCGIEAKTEMSDHIVFRRLVLILLKELGGAGESDLCDILFHFIRGHAESVIDKLHGLLFRIDDHFDLRLISFREFIFSHHIQFLQLRDRVASVGNHLTDKDIMIRINPFLYDRKYIFAVN